MLYSIVIYQKLLGILQHKMYCSIMMFDIQVLLHGNYGMVSVML